MTVEAPAGREDLLLRITRLVDGIDKASVLDPIEVTPRTGGRYTVEQGNHRIVASMFRGLARIPARVREG